jgi:hypothetical protein
MEYKTKPKCKVITAIGNSGCVLIPKNMLLDAEGLNGNVRLDKLGWVIGRDVEITLVEKDEIKIKLMEVNENG